MTSPLDTSGVARPAGVVSVALPLVLALGIPYLGIFNATRARFWIASLILSSAGSGSVIRRPVAASFLALFAAMSALYTIELAAGLTFAGNMAPRLFRSAMLAVGL